MGYTKIGEKHPQPFPSYFRIFPQIRKHPYHCINWCAVTLDGTRLGGDRGRRSNALLAVVFGAEEMNKVFLVEGWGLR